MTDIRHYNAALAAAINADPVLRLAHTAAWLDPVRDDPDVSDDDDPDSLIAFTLSISRRAFPDLYLDVLHALSRGADYAEIDRLVCADLSGRGIPLDDLMWLPWGIPLPAYGVELDDPDFWERHPDAAPVLACFGITPEPNPYQIDVPDVAYRAANTLAERLREQADPAWRQVGEFIGWAFGLSANTVVSTTPELLAEYQPLGWDPDEVEFALEIISEADQIMADAAAGLAFLNTNPAAMQHLQTTIDYLYHLKGKHDERSELTWPRFGECAERAAERQLTVLQLRDDIA